MWQTVIVILCIVAALAYAAWHIHKLTTTKADPCANCDGCALKEARKTHSCRQSPEKRQQHHPLCQ